jgi:hypothetical protein
LGLGRGIWNETDGQGFSHTSCFNVSNFSQEHKNMPRREYNYSVHGETGATWQQYSKKDATAKKNQNQNP